MTARMDVICFAFFFICARKTKLRLLITHHVSKEQKDEKFNDGITEDYIMPKMNYPHLCFNITILFISNCPQTSF